MDNYCSLCHCSRILLRCKSLSLYDVGTFFPNDDLRNWYGWTGQQDNRVHEQYQYGSLFVPYGGVSGNRESQVAACVFLRSFVICNSFSVNNWGGCFICRVSEESDCTVRGRIQEGETLDESRRILGMFCKICWIKRSGKGEDLTND